MSITFVLPRILPLTNVLLRTHWAKRKKEREALAWEVSQEMKKLGPLPTSPIGKARITVERHSVGVCDEDGLRGSMKHLCDLLCVQSKQHPYGLGIITDDGPRFCEQIVRAVKVSRRAEQRTVVTIEAIA